jgi:endonuclease/exonuclease/phosphatase family metal-dependent hydrolase
MKSIGAKMAAVFAVVVGIAVSALAADPGTDGVAVRMLTWNIQMLPTLLDAYSDSLQKMQNERLPWIVEFLSRADYDVVCLQEVLDPIITPRLIEGLRKTYPHIVEPQFAPEGRLLSSGVMFAARFPIKLVAFACYKQAASEDALASKGCTLVEGEKDGVKFQMAGTHLQAGHQDVRGTQYVEMGERILRPNRHEGMPQFLMGDFNTGREGGDRERYAALIRATGMSDAPVDDPVPYSVDNTNSWKRHQENPELIDYVLFNPCGTGSTVKRLTIQRPRHTMDDGRVIDLADHYGVIADTVAKN